MFVLTIKADKMSKPEPLAANRDDVRKAVRLNRLQEVSWQTIPDADEDFWKPISISVRFKDAAGNFADLYLGSWQDGETEWNQNALNIVLNHFGLLRGGKIIGINWSIADGVNYARTVYPDY